MTHNISNSVPIVWNFQEQKGVNVKGSSNKFTNRVALKNPNTNEIIDRIALVSKKPLDAIPKNNLKNKILNLFGFGWVVIKVNDPYSMKSQYLQVNSRSLSKRIFEGNWFKTKDIDITKEALTQLEGLSPKKPSPQTFFQRLFFAPVNFDPLKTFSYKSYNAIKDATLDEIAFQGLSNDDAKSKITKFSGDDGFIVYRALEDNKLHVIVKKEGSFKELSFEKDSDELKRVNIIDEVKDLPLASP